MLKDKRVFVLASGSFSGSHFVDHVLTLGAQVCGINRSPEGAREFLPYLSNPARAKFRFHHLDLNHDLKKIVRLIADFAPHYVVDFAGQGMVAQSWQAPTQWFKTNVLSKIELHEALRQFSFLEAYLRFSTPEVYGSTHGSVRESAALNPSTPYAVTHAAIDMSLLSYHRHYGFPVILTRAANVYGRGQQLYRIIPKALLCARSQSKKKLTLEGGGVSVRNFIAIEDTCRGLVALLLKPEARGQIFHLASDEYTSIRQLVERVARLTAVPMDEFVKIGAARAAQDLAYQIDASKIREWTGWRPEVSLETGLGRVLAWVDENHARLENYSWDYIHKE